MSTNNTIKPFWSTLVLVLILCVYTATALAFDIFLGTAGPGTFSHFSGRMLERTINKQMNMIIHYFFCENRNIMFFTNIIKS